MKATLNSVVLLAGVVSAIAVAEPVAEPKTIQKAIGRFGFCGVAGSSCHRMKRSAEAIADAFAEASPDARYQGRFGFCGVAGSSCALARRSIEEVGELAERSYMEIEARDPKKIQKAIGRFGFCGVAGSSCKRDAVADPKKIQKAIGRFGFCGVAGSSCAMVKRDAEAEAKKIQKAIGRFGFCGVAGSSCKRNADAEQITEIARSINEWDPTYLSEVCHSEGGECAALVKARDAFKAIKRETEEIQAKRSIMDVNAETKRSEEEADLDADLDELEAALDGAVAML